MEVGQLSGLSEEVLVEIQWDDERVAEHPPPRQVDRGEGEGQRLDRLRRVVEQLQRKTGAERPKCVEQHLDSLVGDVEVVALEDRSQEVRELVRDRVEIMIRRWSPVRPDRRESIR